MTASLPKLKKIPKCLHDLSEIDLKKISNSIREFLIHQISITGGHIGANLGTVELTVALHSVFKSPEEPLLFDTGHQGYTHKILTEREHLFSTLNKYGGMNRFLTPKESIHDIIEASHAGTAISIGLGMAKARKLEGDDKHVIAIVGDAALAEGSSWEALNHAAVENSNLIIVVNDNGFAISPGYGGLNDLLASGKKNSKAFFEALGFCYIGPIDGHDMSAMRKAFKKSKKEKRVPIVHVKSKKGNGWTPADDHPYRMHFLPPYDPKTGKLIDNTKPKETYADIAGSCIEKAMSINNKIVCLTPSTLYATGLEKAFKEHPERCIDPGMEEQHTMSMTVGLALQGFLPVVAYQSTFMQRAFDQLIHDVAFNNFPTLILSMRSGFSGYDNPTHHGIYDISFMQSIPNLRIFYPKDGKELEKMIFEILDSLDGPVVIMMPYGPSDQLEFGSYNNILKPEEILRGEDTVLITVGNKIQSAFRAAKNIKAGLINLRAIHPLPENELIDLIKPYKRIVTVEEAVLNGGVGSSVSSLLSDHKLTKELHRIGIPRVFVEPGSNEELCNIYGLDSAGILKSIQSCWQRDL